MTLQFVKSAFHGLLLILGGVNVALALPPYVARDAEPLYKKFLDTDFPFIEATVDMRGVAPAGTDDNLIPRAIVIPLEHDVFVCFDTELLRVAGIWQGGYLSPNGLAMLSYPVPLRKMGPGQSKLPQPLGQVVFSTGLYPGWQAGQLSFEDPRPRGVDPKELGRGPLDPTTGEWLGMEDAGNQAVLHYRLFDGKVRERFQAKEIDGDLVVLRTIEVNGLSEEIRLILAERGDGKVINRGSDLEADPEGNRIFHRLVASGNPQVLSVGYNFSKIGVFLVSSKESELVEGGKANARWSHTIVAGIELGEPQGSYVVDEAILPYPNPWKRRIRPVAIDFSSDGEAFLVTFDGDVYRISGLGSADNQIKWKRIAAGFNEPQSIRIRGDEVFVFSRLGITRLVDNDNDGETDFYEMFSNRFNQSADTRDYPLSLALRPDGSFIIVKGGQQASAKSVHSGRVMSISADGRKVEYFGYGLRNGYISGHPTKDIITASDQQGNWVPSTPFHIVRKGSYLGYQPGAPFKDYAEIQSPALWIPHRVAQSGIEQIWPVDERMGDLNGSILYIEYKKPSLFRIYVPEDPRFVQTAGSQLPIEFETPLLKGAMNPVDGSAYFVGFQIWDSIAPRLEGLCRLRVLPHESVLPRSVEVYKDGVRLSFEQTLGPELARDPSNYQVSSWNYVRTEEYGSPQFGGDGEPGVDEWMVHSVLLSKDRKSVFLAIADVRETMQLEVQYNLFGEWQPLYFTINELNRTRLKDYKFESINFSKLFASESVPRVVKTSQKIVSVARGQQLYSQMGCVGCHSIDGSTEGRSGPTWLGAYKSRRKLKGGGSVRVDEEYLRNSILDPAVAITEGFDGQEAGMPSYKGILSDEDVESLVMFIRSLR
tara:strand:- start:5234 stop:7867 length:2634 start_codon:yes stop_codon:yes gene_type:complete